MTQFENIVPEFRVTVRRRHATDEDHPHEIEPTYANYFFVTRVGSDVFLDVCVLPPDDLIVNSPDKQGDREVRIVTIDRFVMGLSSFQQLADQILEVRDRLKEQGLLPVEPLIKLGGTQD